MLTFFDIPTHKNYEISIDGVVRHKKTNRVLKRSMSDTGYYTVLYGEESRHHKLTQNDVDYIRKVYKKYDAVFGGRALAKRFNVTESCISAIVRGISWGVVIVLNFF